VLPDQPAGGAAPGATLGTYRIERLLGRGGMGAVFLAYDTTLDRQVALKVVDSGVDPSVSRAQLLREGRSAAALNHPNICTIHEVGDADGTAFIAMEYVEGRSLREQLASGPLPLTDVLRYGITAADAVAYAHERGVVHRDLKTANVIVDASGRLKIVDFGLARRHTASVAAAAGTVTESAVLAGSIAGTPYAMAPEQVRGEAADARTDIWALGVLLHELASGAAPFAGATLPELFSAILRDRPTPLAGGLPAALQRIVERCLEKDPGRRYQQAAEIRAALEAVQSGAPVPRTSPKWSRRSMIGAAAAGIVIVGAGAIGGWRGWFGAPATVRLAVLPFRNLSGDDAFGEGLTEETITELGRLRSTRLSVIASRSSSRYRNQDASFAQIGRELGVDFILEGTAQREGSRIRVNAALVDVRDQSQRWSDSFEREMAGLLALQSDIARGVANALSVALLPEDRARLATAPAVNPAAYEAYLKGLGHASRLTAEDLDRALAYFETATRLDPQFALGYLGIGQVWSGRQQMHFATPSEAAAPLRAAVDRARALEPDLPEVHFRMAGRYTWTDWNWAAAEPEFRRALELRPDFAEARAFYAHYLLIVGRPAEAMAQIEQAIRSDPFNDLVQSLYGVVLMAARRHDDAVVQFRRALETAARSQVALTGLARALYYSGKLEESFVAEKAIWAARNQTDMLDALDRGWHESGYTGAMRAAAELHAAQSRASGRAPLTVGLLYLRAGDRDRAVEWAERAFDGHDPNIPYLVAGPHWDPVRSDPRFRALVQRLKLPE
jgi:TolB-like protein/tRNA A-37 threonylcarbamoyl transferase component Bud32/Flp pilus assembly protein TadD